MKGHSSGSPVVFILHAHRVGSDRGIILETGCNTLLYDVLSRLHGFVWIYCVPKLRFMKRRFWNDIHHLLGFPVPSA